MRRMMTNTDSRFYTGDVVKMINYEADKPIADDNFPYAVVILPIRQHGEDLVDLVELDGNFAPLFPRGWNAIPEEELGEVVGHMAMPKQARYNQTSSLSHRIEFAGDPAKTA